MLAPMVSMRPGPSALRCAAMRGKVAPTCRNLTTSRRIATATLDAPGLASDVPPPSISHRKDAIKHAKPFSAFLTDSFDRQHDYLRISITERCNLRCLYCMPEEGVPLSPPAHLLTTPEIFYLASLFVSQGVTKIRLTGGEPTVRHDIVPLMQSIGTLRPKGLHELALTTNGISLHRKLDSMVEAGLTGVNLSLDTLDPFQFQIMTRRNGFDAVMRSIDRILEMKTLGADIKLKVNCVVMRGMNEREIIPFVEMGRDKDIEVRFIEYMPFGGNKWTQGKMISFQEMLDIIRSKYPELRSVRGHRNDTSKTYEVPGFVGKVGFITSMTNDFCGTCNRLRITGDGNLKVCLHGNAEVSLRDLLRKDNNGDPIDQAAFERIKQIEMDRREGRLSDETILGWGQREQELLQVIGAAVKRKAEKHADMGDLEKLENRPMILIGEPQLAHQQASTLTSFPTPQGAHQRNLARPVHLWSSNPPPHLPFLWPHSMSAHQYSRAFSTGVSRSANAPPFIGLSHRRNRPKLRRTEKFKGLRMFEVKATLREDKRNTKERALLEALTPGARTESPIKKLITQDSTAGAPRARATQVKVAHKSMRELEAQLQLERQHSPVDDPGEWEQFRQGWTLPSSTLRSLWTERRQAFKKLRRLITWSNDGNLKATSFLKQDAEDLKQKYYDAYNARIQDLEGRLDSFKRLLPVQEGQAVDKLPTQEGKAADTDWAKESNPVAEQIVASKRAPSVSKATELGEQQRQRAENARGGPARLVTQSVALGELEARRDALLRQREEILRETKRKREAELTAIKKGEAKLEPHTPTTNSELGADVTPPTKSTDEVTHQSKSFSDMLGDTTKEMHKVAQRRWGRLDRAGKILDRMRIRSSETGVDPLFEDGPLELPPDTHYFEVPHLDEIGMGYVPGHSEIPEDIRLNFDGSVAELQLRVFQMQALLKNMYPKIDSLPYKVWLSENRVVLQTWLKILAGKWETRFDRIAARQPVPDILKKSLDQMIREHDLSADAAERMVARFAEIFVKRETLEEREGGVNGKEGSARSKLDDDPHLWSVLSRDLGDDGHVVPEKQGHGLKLRPNAPLARRLTAEVGSSRGLGSTRHFSTSSRRLQNYDDPTDRPDVASPRKVTLKEQKDPTASSQVDDSVAQTSIKKRIKNSLPHLTPMGTAHMVSIADKAITKRTAIAQARVCFTNPETVGMIKAKAMKKGDVLSVARIAGIMAAKRCPDLIPLAHPINLTHVSVDLQLANSRSAPSQGTPWAGCVNIQSTVECTGKTGVEMEALTAVSATALTVIDMCKAVDKGAYIALARVVFKDGGRSGKYERRGWKDIRLQSK